MFEWIKFIGEFILGIVTGIVDFLRMLADAVMTIHTAFAAAPSFLAPILFLMLSVVVIMWVVNIF